MANEASESWGKLALYSLVKNPFLLPSAALHLLLFYLLTLVVLSVNPDENIISVPIKLIELGEGRSRDKSIGPDRGPGGPRSLPKLGSPEIPRQRTGKLDAGSLENTTPSNESTPAPENVSPPLPRPKLLAEVGRPRPAAIKESSPDSLVQLPTKDTANFAAPLNPESNQKSIAAIKGKGAGEGIRALSEGIQVPGALKGAGSASGPYGVPGGIREGKGTSGGGTGSGIGGGSSSGLRGTLSGDYGQYLKL
ncbi:MAG: hypothetical protein AABZ71_01945, partial [Candidatus Binatota bacterium]